jgi:ABC-type lipoprotein release transport system permease subunit
MQTTQLIKRSLSYYWRTNLAVVFGVAAAVAVLAGALLVGDSVRASLRDLFVQRLGNTDSVITAQGFFLEQLAADIQNHEQFAREGFAAACPLVALDGTITHEANRRVGSGIRVYGVDGRFWKFHSRADASPHGHQVLVSESLARELGTREGDSLLLRIEKPSEIPVESLHSRKEDLGSTLRLTVLQTLATDALGEFSVQPQQSAVRAIFVPLDLLQKTIDQERKVNLILVSETSRTASDQAKQTAKRESLSRILEDRTSLEDFGIKLRTPGAQQSISLEHDSKMVNDSLANVAIQTGAGLSLHPVPVFSYLANSIRFGERSIPYSLVTALDQDSFELLRRRGGETGGRGGGETVRATRGRLWGAATWEAKSRISPSPRLSISPEQPPIILNEWAARDLGVKVGDAISLEYYLWHEGGHLETKTAEFRLAWVVPIKGLAADRDLVPEYPGISGSESLAGWDPPFPVDLKRVRKQDEDYWQQYRTTPKAFIQLSVGQALWQTRFGKLTSLRFIPSGDLPVETALAAYQQKLRAALNPNAMGFNVIFARAEGLAASRGATDFGEYFLYFSFFLVVSALLLTALFFKLGVEQRWREIGILQAVGFPAATIRALFLAEGMILAIIGSVIGLVGALAYGQLMMLGLRTWWVDAVGTTMLRLHISPLSVLLGAAGGVFASLICVVWTLRQVGRSSTRSLLTGAMGRNTETRGRGETGPVRHPNVAEREKEGPVSPHPRVSASHQRVSASSHVFSSLRIALLLTLLGLLLLIAASLHLVGQAAGFFGGGMLLLVAFLCYQSAWLKRDGGRPIVGTGWWSVSRLGFRNATSRPGRSVLCIALIASAAFIIVAVDSFRHRGETLVLDKKSGSGGFPLMAQSLLPLVHDPNTRDGREALNLATDDVASPLSGVTFARFRVRPGDDASCLNLYQPRNPKIIAPTADFADSNRFLFQNSLASTSEEKENPWLLLDREFADNAVPVIGDANSMTYVLHLKLGDDLVLQQGDRPVRLRLVGALADSIFQSELVMAEKQFLRLFPEQEGYRFFLIDTPLSPLSPSPGESTAISAALEDRLADFGFDVQPTGERLANFHRVENTYLSTFQMLGGLGLLLGTLGMAAVLLRNVLERRRELALLRAVGYNSSHLTLMVVAENALLLFCGLVTGTVCALLAIAPVFVSRHAQPPSFSLGLLLLAVLISGLTASIVATWATLRSPLLPALRAE